MFKLFLILVSLSITSTIQGAFDNTLIDSQFLISVDSDSQIFIDFQPVGLLNKGEYKIYKVFPGEHYIEAKSIDGKGKYRRKHTVESGHQQIVEIKLLPSDETIGIIGEFIDLRDNYRYKTVTIKGKTWLAENLRYTIYRSWCSNNNQDNCKNFGRTYHFDFVMDAVPKGWHLPTKQEWLDLVGAYSSETLINDLKPGGKSNFNLVYGGSTFVRMGSNTIFESLYLNSKGLFWMDEKPVLVSTNTSNKTEVTGISFTDIGYRIEPIMTKQHGDLYGNTVSVRCVRDE